jgi:hypothetical protein
MTEYYKAIEVADIARELIKDYHPALGEAKIVYLFRDKAPKSKGKVVWGTTKKTSPIEKALTGYDFVIWVSEDIWVEIDANKKHALVDHELSHCGLDENGNWIIYSHDFEGFNAVLQRYGFWQDDLINLRRNLIQMKLLFDKPHLKAVGGE